MHYSLLKILKSLQSRIDLTDKIKILFDVSLTGPTSFCRPISTMILKKIIRMIFVTLPSELLYERLQITLVQNKIKDGFGRLKT
jgi:hypothetical protein